MTSGDFAIGLMTIITGLAIADMVISLHALLMNRRRVGWDWLAIVAALYVFLLIVSTWGIYFRNLANQQIAPPLWLFAVYLGQSVTMYLAARASLPDEVTAEGARLAEHYAEISRYFWGSLAFTFVIYLGFSLASTETAGVTNRYVSPAAQLVMMLVLITVPNRRVHALLVPAIVVLFCYDHLLSPMFV
jgi:hypothetical protein